MSKWSECAHIRCVTCVCVWRVVRAPGSSASTLDGGRVWAWCWRAVIVTTTNHILLWCLHEAIWLADASVGAWKVASAPRFRHALRQALMPTPRVNAAWARARAHTRHTHTHVTHRMCVRTQITWTWLCTRGKKLYKYCSFSHTNRSFRVLGHQCVVTMGIV